MKFLPIPLVGHSDAHSLIELLCVAVIVSVLVAMTAGTVCRASAHITAQLRLLEMYSNTRIDMADRLSSQSTGFSLGDVNYP
jgi:type II secretory pathway pseudopilin PulG